MLSHDFKRRNPHAPSIKTQEPTFPSIKKLHRSCSKASGSVAMDSTATLMGSGAPSHAPMKYVYVYAFVRVCVYVHARMYACFMRVCMRVCVYACFCLYVCMHARRTMSPMGAAFWLDRTIHPLGGAAVGEDFQRGWRARWRWGWHHPS